MKWMLPAYKPGSVECCHSDGHSSGSVVAHALEQPTRSVLIGAGRPSLPIWPCSHWGLPCHGCYQPRGGLLPHRFTLTCAPASRSHRRSVLCCTFRQHLAVPPRRYLAARPLEPGLSSSIAYLPATIRPTASTYKLTNQSGKADDEAMTGRPTLPAPTASTTTCHEGKAAYTPGDAHGTGCKSTVALSHHHPADTG